MDKKIIKGLIDEKLEVIQEQFSIIRGYDGKIPIIEIDLMMASIRDLYELVLNLQVENTGGFIPRPAVSAAENQPPLASADDKKVEEEEDLEETNEELLEEEEVIPLTATVRLGAGIISMEPVKEEPVDVQTYGPVASKIEEPEPLPEPEPVTPLEQPTYRIPEPVGENITSPPAEQETDMPSESAHGTPKITFDLFSDNAGNTLADKLKEGQEKRIADRLQENKITDLRTSIGINDKFLFINELFDGNLRIYEEAIQKLNSSLTIAQTDLLLLDLKIVYNWDSESPTVKKFVELVRKKF